MDFSTGWQLFAFTFFNRLYYLSINTTFYEKDFLSGFIAHCSFCSAGLNRMQT
jgi:hypothetical protein